MVYSYFEGLILLFFSILTLLVIVFNIIGVFLTIMVFIYALSNSILRWMVPFFRSNVDDKYISRDVTDIHYLNFLIGAFFDKVALLSAL